MINKRTLTQAGVVLMTGLSSVAATIESMAETSLAPRTEDVCLLSASERSSIKHVVSLVLARRDVACSSYNITLAELMRGD